VCQTDVQPRGETARRQRRGHRCPSNAAGLTSTVNTRSGLSTGSSGQGESAPNARGARGERLAEAEAVASVLSKGNFYDHPVAEAFSSLKAGDIRNPVIRPRGE
jgi:hypothetical protein